MEIYKRIGTTEKELIKVIQKFITELNHGRDFIDLFRELPESIREYMGITGMVYFLKDSKKEREENEKVYWN